MDFETSNLFFTAQVEFPTSTQHKCDYTDSILSDIGFLTIASSPEQLEPVLLTACSDEPNEIWAKQMGPTAQVQLHVCRSSVRLRALSPSSAALALASASR